MPFGFILGQSRRRGWKWQNGSEVYLKRRDAESEEFLCDIQSHAKAFSGGRREAAQHSAYSCQCLWHASAPSGRSALISITLRLCVLKETPKLK